MITTILPTAYFAPLSWYRAILSSDRCLIDIHEHYLKQTCRNRCLIASPDGRLSLTVPVCRDGGQSLSKTPVAEIRISEHDNWRRRHLQAICSAYGETPFFKYYIDEFKPFFTQSTESLYAFNAETHQTVMRLLGVKDNTMFTDGYITPAEAEANEMQDMRGLRLPGRVSHSDKAGQAMADRDQDMPYHQIFAHKTGFLSDLSILDLLFNVGPESVAYLISPDAFPMISHRLQII